MSSAPTPGPWRACTDPNDMPQLLYSGLIAPIFYSPDAYVAVVSDTQDVGDLEECQANAYLIAAAPAMREALFFAMHALEYANEGCFCECEDCEQCGKPVDECTGTECSKTCQCSSCRYCVTELAYESAKVAFAAAGPPAGRGAGAATSTLEED